MNRILFLLSFIILLSISCSQKVTVTESAVNTMDVKETVESEPDKMKLNYPLTKKTDQVDVYHGIEVADPYRWLEDDLSDETAVWVEAQNKVTFGYLDEISFKDQLKNRIKNLVNYENISAPFKEGKYEYFSKNDGTQDHSVYYRTLLDSDNEPTVFLDPNTFSDDGTVALGSIYFTKDGSLAAYTISEGGSGGYYKC